MKQSILILAVLLVLAPSISYGAFQNDLFYGSTGPQVLELQEFLADQGVYSGPITGNFYSLTQTAVRKFQAKYVITPASGYFGPKSMAKANELLLASTPAEEGTEVVETPPTIDVSTILAQIANIQAQIKQIQENQIAESQKQTQVLETIKTNTTPVLGAAPTPPAPVYIEKKFEIGLDNTGENIHGTYHGIYVAYFENGIQKRDVEVVLSSDDNGTFVGNKASGDTYEAVGSVSSYTRAYRNRATFGYRPMATGTRVLTATANGASTTIQVSGQTEKCANKPVDNTKEIGCNQ